MEVVEVVEGRRCVERATRLRRMTENRKSGSGHRGSVHLEVVYAQVGGGAL